MTKSQISTFAFNNQHTKLGLEIADLHKILSTANEKAIKAHRLNFYQILVITKGNGIHEVDFQKIPFSKNTVIPVAMGQVQRFDYNTNIEGYAILFTPDFIIKENFDYAFLYEFTIFLHSINPITINANQTTHNLIHEMITEQQKTQAFYTDEFQRNFLKNFLVQLERNKRKQTNIVCNDSLKLFMNFRKLLEERINYKTKVVDLCEHLNVSAKKLNNSLKLYNSMTAKQYVDYRVLLEIKRLLVYSSLSVKEIAYEIGFEDPTNFTKYFKTRMNILPTEYRKQEMI